MCLLFLLASSPSCVRFASRGKSNSPKNQFLRLVLAISSRAFPWALILSATLHYDQEYGFDLRFWIVSAIFALVIVLLWVALPSAAATRIRGLGGESESQMVRAVALSNLLTTSVLTFLAINHPHVRVPFEALWGNT